LEKAPRREPRGFFMALWLRGSRETAF